jgi:hypothetical protein
MPKSDFLAALRALQEGGVKFVGVGGLAAVLNGAPVLEQKQRGGG